MHLYFPIPLSLSRAAHSNKALLSITEARTPPRPPRASPTSSSHTERVCVFAEEGDSSKSVSLPWPCHLLAAERRTTTFELSFLCAPNNRLQNVLKTLKWHAIVCVCCFSTLCETIVAETSCSSCTISVSGAVVKIALGQQQRAKISHR